MAARGTVAAAVLALPMTASICYGVASPALAADLPELSELASPIVDVDFDPVADRLVERAELAEIDREAMIELAHERMEQRHERADAMRERAEERREHADALRERHMEQYAEGRRQWAEGRIQYARGRQQWADGRIQWAEGRVEHAKSRAKHNEARAHAQAEWGEAMGEAIAESVSVAMAHVPEVIEDCRYPDAPVTSIENGDRVTMYICDTAGDRMALKALEQARRGIETSEGMSSEMRQEILRDLDREIRELKRTIRS